MLQLRAVAALLFVLACAGCASVTQGTTDSLRIDTVTSDSKEVIGADCTLTNDKGTTPARSGTTTTVHRSGQTLEIVCKKEGLPDAIASLMSRVTTAAYGNILVGGLIGAAVDASSGAAYSYPHWVQLVFGEHAVFDATNEIQGVAMRAPGALLSSAVHGTATAHSEPASASAAQVAAASQAIVPPTAAAGRTVYDYQLRDGITGAVRTVKYSPDPRESGDTMLSMAGAVGGEFAAAMPPGGWLQGGADPRYGWHVKYDKGQGEQQMVSMDLDARPLGQESLILQRRTVRTVGVQFTGYTLRGAGVYNNGAAPYTATLWYAPDLHQVVKFQARTQGGRGSQRFVIDEQLELMEVHAD